MTAGGAVAAVRVIVVAVGDDAASPPAVVDVVADAEQQPHWHSAGRPFVLNSSTASVEEAS